MKKSCYSKGFFNMFSFRDFCHMNVRLWIVVQNYLTWYFRHAENPVITCYQTLTLAADSIRNSIHRTFYILLPLSLSFSLCSRCTVNQFPRKPGRLTTPLSGHWSQVTLQHGHNTHQKRLFSAWRRATWFVENVHLFVHGTECCGSKLVAEKHQRFLVSR